MIFVDVRPMFVSFCLHQACPTCQHSRACDPPRLNKCSALHIAAQRFKRCWSKLIDVDGCQSSNEPSGFPFHASNISTTSNGSCGSSVFPWCEEQRRCTFSCTSWSCQIMSWSIWSCQIWLLSSSSVTLTRSVEPSRAESSRVESSPDSPGLIIVSATDHVQLICHWACTNQIQSVSDCPKASSAKIHRHQLNAQAGPAAGETKKWGNHLDHLTVEEPLHIFAHLCTSLIIWGKILSSSLLSGEMRRTWGHKCASFIVQASIQLLSNWKCAEDPAGICPSNYVHLRISTCHILPYPACQGFGIPMFARHGWLHRAWPVESWGV